MSDGADTSERRTATFVVINRLGLHARAAMLLVETAGRFEAIVEITKDGQTVDAKSIMELLLLAATQGSTIEVSAIGKDAEAALAAIGELVTDRFREAE